MAEPRVAKTSVTKRPGYAVNTGSSGITNAEWKDAFIQWAAWKWAGSTPEQRQTFLGNSWNTQQFGSPDASDNIFLDPVSGQKKADVSAQTMLALSKFAQQYQGGDPEIDSEMPWIAPRPDEYIESPAETASRIATEQWERNFDRQIRNDERLAKQQEFANQFAQQEHQDNIAQQNADREAANARAQAQLQGSVYNTQVGGITDIYGTQGGIYGNQLGLLGDIYNTQGSMYNNTLNQQGNIFDSLARYQSQMDALRQSGLSDAGGLALGLQGLEDARVNQYISLKQNPGDFVGAEYTARALNAPEGYTGPLFSNNPSIQEIINRQMNFNPSAPPQTPGWYGQNPTQPTAPTMPSPPGAPSIPGAPNINIGGSSSGGSIGGGSSTPTNPSTPRPGQGGNTSLPQGQITVGGTPDTLNNAIMTWTNLMRQASDAATRGDQAAAANFMRTADEFRRQSDAAARAGNYTIQWPNSPGAQPNPPAPTWVNNANNAAGSPFGTNPQPAASSGPSAPPPFPTLAQVQSGQTGSAQPTMPAFPTAPTSPAPSTGGNFGGGFNGGGANSGATGMTVGQYLAQRQPTPLRQRSSLPGFAMGGMTTAPQLMAGDTANPGQPNPEIIDNPTGAPLAVTNEQDILQKIEQITMMLQQSQDPEEQEVLTEMLDHYQMLLDNISQGKTGEAVMGRNMGQAQVPAFAFGTDFGWNPASNSNVNSWSGPSNLNTPNPGPASLVPGVGQGAQPSIAGYNQVTTQAAPSPSGVVGAPPPFPTMSSYTPPIPLAPNGSPSLVPLGSSVHPTVAEQARVTWNNPVIPINQSMYNQGLIGQNQYNQTLAMNNANPQSTGQYQSAGFNAAGGNNFAPVSGMPNSTEALARAIEADKYRDQIQYQNEGNKFGNGGTFNESNIVAPGMTPQPLMTAPGMTPNYGGGSTPGITVLPDSAYQNLPFLHYLQNRGNRGMFNTLSTGNTEGAFGMRLPEAGALNYKTILELARNPVSWDMASGAYRSASRDLPTIAALVKARAPLGQALQSSVIRTR